MSWKILIPKANILAFIVGLASAVCAQSPNSGGGTQSGTQQQEPAKIGEYVVTQSIDIGYRFAAINSDKLSPTDPTYYGMYDTLVNLHQGPRLLDQTFSMQSPDRTGLLFDDLLVSSFGFGGDPNEVLRARIGKFKLYDFTALYRRDWNAWDYNLFVNPLNPTTSNPSIPVLNSPHSYNNDRRMTDLSLTLAPESPIDLRLGYSRNVFEAPSVSSIPQTSPELIETLLVQQNNVAANVYQIGLDLKVLPRTRISYDQFVTHTNYNTTWQDKNFPWLLSNGVPADLGYVWDTSNGTPCAVPFSPAQPIVNPVCNFYTSYFRANPESTDTPTEQLSLQSNYFPKFDISAKVSYSKTSMRSTFSDLFTGWQPDLGYRKYTTNGPIIGSRINVSVDGAVTYHITNKFRIIDQYHYYDFRLPTTWNSFFATWLGTSAFSPIGPTPDSVDNTFFVRFLGEKTNWNLFELAYDARHFGGKLGYRYRSSLYEQKDELNDITSGDLETGEDTVAVDFQTGILGFWVRPNDKLKVNFDSELTTASNFLTRTSPRRLLQYRGQVTYHPTRSLVLTATANVYEARNGVAEIDFNAHNRNFGATATMLHSDRLSFQVAYNYTNSASNSFVCYQGDPAVVNGISTSCAADTDGGAPFETYQTYSNSGQVGAATILLKPTERIQLNVGYSIVSSNGSSTLFNQLAPWGILRSVFQRPIANVQVYVKHGVSFIGGWNYYDYHEQDPYYGPTYPRNFHANLTTLSVRYSF